MEEVNSITVFDWVLIGMSMMFILALAVIVFFLTYQKRLLKQQKEHQQKEADYQQQLLRANLQSQEKERNRIGKDLHDEVGALLSTSKLYFRHLEQEVDPKKFFELKEKALTILDQTMTSVRRVSHDLKPVVLERLGLVEAISNIADQLNESQAIQVEFSSKWQGTLDKEFELNWFRIVQELMNNALRHSEATQVRLALNGDEARITMSYQDNGVGLSNPTLMMDKGLGMQNITSRLGLMRGELSVEENKEQGLSLKLYSATREIEKGD
ncbi:sensor histidine kinase [Roseivirga sp. E12]|uniref:sensor histidine kinase n=1 Tax=Roseivirga sp. E12 TaxID=2819237 RepID=UPI001ABC9602|nr:histidine kinase [Roseivirga sp. E12]MBO3698069.1 hypothetical protein [Roseivirga sp. E12]